jgi:hypothetical protein
VAVAVLLHDRAGAATPPVRAAPAHAVVVSHAAVAHAAAADADVAHAADERRPSAAHAAQTVPAEAAVADADVAHALTNVGFLLPTLLKLFLLKLLLLSV